MKIEKFKIQMHSNHRSIQMVDTIFLLIENHAITVMGSLI
jgi:hypothetical protein